MKIVIVSLNALGDTYLSAAALAPLKKHFETAEFEFIVQKHSASLVSALGVEKFFCLEKKNIANILRLLFVVRRRRYEMAFSFFPGLLNTLFLLASCSPVKAGYLSFFRRRDWYDESQRVFVHGVPREKLFWRPTMSYLERIEMVLRAFNLNEKVQKPRVAVAGSERRKVGNFAVVHLISKMCEKSFSADAIYKVCRYLARETSLKVFLIGRSEEFGDSLQGLNQFVEPVFDAPIHVLAQLITGSSIFIGVDSFPLHIADAMEMKVLGIFGPTNPVSALSHPHGSVRFMKQSLQDVTGEEVIDSIRPYLKAYELHHTGI
ncbi:MAG: glycosyltransferase family 9 protein [Bacteroidota bacterium]|nr:glycosyltransferase family 9 protein [Bacteroidota bacterium]